MTGGMRLSVGALEANGRRSGEYQEERRRWTAHLRTEARAEPEGGRSVEYLWRASVMKRRSWERHQGWQPQSSRPSGRP